MVQIIHMPTRDAREQPVTYPEPLPRFSGELAASAIAPRIAGDLAEAHYALEEWGSPDPQAWNRPVYRRAAIKAIRLCSEVCVHGAESAGEEIALAKFQALEQALASVDTDKSTRRKLIRQFAATILGVYNYHLEHGAVLSPVERAEYAHEGRVYEGEEDEAS
jgi:hypothetical protein